MNLRKIVLILILLSCVLFVFYTFIQPNNNIHSTDSGKSQNIDLQSETKIKDFKFSLYKLNAKGFAMGWYNDSNILMASDPVIDDSKMIRECINQGVYKWKGLNYYDINTEKGTIMLKDKVITDGLISPDGKNFVLIEIGSDDKKHINIKNLVNNKEIELLSTGKVLDLNWSDNGRFLAGLTVDSLWVYDVEKNNPRDGFTYSIKLKDGPINIGTKVKVSNNGTELLANGDYGLRLMKTSSDELSSKAINNRSVKAFDFYNDKVLFTDSIKNEQISSLCLYNPVTEKTTKVLERCENFSLNRDKEVILADNYLSGKLYAYNIKEEVLSNMKEVFSGYIYDRILWNVNGTKAIFYGKKDNDFNYYAIVF